MKEKHFAYKIYREASRLVCTHYEFEEDKMVDLLKEIRRSPTHGLYWIFKQLNGKPEEALCIIDCSQKRIYYHYSGDVENLDETIEKLSQSKS